MKTVLHQHKQLVHHNKWEFSDFLIWMAVYIVLGPYHEHIGLVVAMDDRKLFDQGEYFVVGVDLDRYDPDKASKYLRGLLKDDLDGKAVQAFENYLGIVSSPPGADFENFSLIVNDYLERPPFNFPNPLNLFGGRKSVPSRFPSSTLWVVSFSLQTFYRFRPKRPTCTMRLCSMLTHCETPSSRGMILTTDRPLWNEYEGVNTTVLWGVYPLIVPSNQFLL